MKRQVTLTISSLVSILLFSLHWADEVARGLEPGTVSASGGLVILAQAGCCPSSCRRVDCGERGEFAGVTFSPDGRWLL